MTIKELKQALKYFNDDEEIIVFYETKNRRGKLGHIESIISCSINGNALQLNCESVLESISE